MANRLTRIWKPAIYQGAEKRRRYFEGWYFKQVDAAAQTAVAVIPGVSYSADGSASHAFIQVVSGSGFNHYFAFPIDAFRADAGSEFGISIAENRFTASGFSLALDDGEARVTAEVRFGAWSPWPVRALSPGIMGWYRFVPGMETYHAVLSMDHTVDGRFELDGHAVDLAGGRGYVEKDWGRSFPSSWIWAQSNSFERPGVSVTLSVAKVPWMTGAFVGNIAGLLVDGELHRFATYTGARAVSVETGNNTAHVVLRDARQELEVDLVGCAALILKSPVLGSMDGRDAESIGGSIEVTLRELRGGSSIVRYHGIGRQAGIEVMNDADELRP